MRRLFLVFLFIISSLNALELERDDFNSNSESWTGGTRDNNRYRIARDATASKSYNFNVGSYASKNVVISFDVVIDDGWETSDALKVRANGVTTVFNQTDGSYQYTLNTVIGADGILDLSFNPDTSSDSERAWIDNIVITFITSDAINDTFAMVKNTVLSANLLSNDIGPTLSVTSHTNPSHGTATVAANGTLTYTPNANYMGSDTFNYTIEDVNGYEDTATVTITVTDIITSGYRDFSLRKQLYTLGDMRTIGNSVLVPPTTQNATICSTYTNGPFTVDASSANNYYYLCGYHVDTTTAGLSNSTSAELSLPTGAKVIWAGLYWQAIVANGSFNTSMTVKIRQEAGSNIYNDVTPDRLDYLQDAGHTGYTSYSAFADVSEYFGEGKWNEGNYTVANIPVYEGKIDDLGSYGAWTLVVAYTNADDPNEKFRSFSIFDGWKVIDSTNPNVDVDVTGFYTPDQTDIEAKISVFAAEGDKHISGDVLKTTNYTTGTDVTLAAVTNNTFNSTVNGGDSRTPLLTNNNGIDIQTFSIGDYLTPKQAKMRFTFTSTQDRYWPSMIAFSTELYVPRFCYDYGYEQNGLPFTEENNGTAMPYITGTLPNTSNINVSLYIRNQEASDVLANNVKLNITDINTTQAIYERDSVSITYPGTFTPIHKTDPLWPLSVDDAFIKNIPLGDMEGEEYVYTYYTLVPHSTGEISIPIVGTFSYDLVIPQPDGTTLTLPYSSRVGGDRLQMCSADNFSYTPEWGIFSVVDAGLYSSENVNRYYDLTTQVARRAGNFRIASFEPSSLDTPKAVTTIVAVEMIDASQFHDVDAACREPSSAVTPRVWIGFENNVTQVNFNASTIQNAITNGMVSDVITGEPSLITSASEFFKTATPNAAFRVTFNTLADQNDSLIQIETTNQGIRISNFANIHQVYPHCRQFVTNPSNDTMTNDTAVACSNNGNNSTYKDVAICMECLYGARTQVLCSRDNFAIRPESYTVVLKDVNQTNSTQTQVFAPEYTGVVTPNTGRVNVASGYDYRYDINATNHSDNNATQGYTRYFSEGGSDYNISLVWEPSIPKTGCNDTESKPQNFNLINGTVSAEGNLSQVGEYRLNIIDTTWTAVDWDPAMQTHQVGSHFLSAVECIQNSSDVPIQGDVIALSGANINNLVGCTINSTHDNIENGLKYRDYQFTFHPYKFDMSTIIFGTGTTPQEINSTIGSGFIYMSDISRDDGMNMSLRATGAIRASGYNDVVTTNFVTDCYADDLNLSMVSDNNLTHVQGVAYQLRFMDFNSSGSLIYDSNATNLNTAALTVPLTFISDGNFTKDTAGSLWTVSRLNYDRNVSQPLSPFEASFSALNVQCVTTADCTMQADLSNTYEAVGDRDMDFNVTHGYGRLIPRDVRVFGDIDFTANGWYEVFNLPLIGVTPLSASRNTPQWFINRLHNDLNDGDANVTRLQSNVGSTAINNAGAVIEGIETYNFNRVGTANIPYSRKAHIDTAPWLWYGVNALEYADPAPANVDCLTHPCFNINVAPAVGRGGSATDSTLSGDKKNKETSKGNGVIYDYTPATR